MFLTKCMEIFQILFKFLYMPPHKYFSDAEREREVILATCLLSSDSVKSYCSNGHYQFVKGSLKCEYSQVTDCCTEIMQPLTDGGKVRTLHFFKHPFS